MTQPGEVTPEGLFGDAEQLLAGALRELETGDVRQAAEKAWGAIKRSTDALILARTGEEPRTTGQTTTAIRRLGRQDPAIEPLEATYSARAWNLHGNCFYDGRCEPVEALVSDIRGAADYIRQARDQASRR